MKFKFFNVIVKVLLVIQGPKGYICCHFPVSLNFNQIKLSAKARHGGACLQCQHLGGSGRRSGLNVIFSYIAHSKLKATLSYIRHSLKKTNKPPPKQTLSKLCILKNVSCVYVTCVTYQDSTVYSSSSRDNT